MNMSKSTKASASLGVIGILGMILLIDFGLICIYSAIGIDYQTTTGGESLGFVGNFITGLTNYPIITGIFAIINVIALISIFIILRGGSG